ncbi:uncharacterized protein B0J16DRAFT_406254 [Fusarium flagelliforme]|uniref:uncharacterized protein n=1 Tax=Fusarium flagelliforme TaxID=2675880 RepID=UPI001E8E564C|nr:uncharacterized protein B0J16DRAFT_406254 [Fusarium flagelliforme]KAH7173882.1 hypothetical protein B0J16DRAFT_406254 [Fusarium flagelliforme]
MAEFAAVGVAASILQVIDFGIRFVATTWQASQSEHAFLTSLKELQNSSERFRQAQNDLQSTRPGSTTAINSLLQKSVTISKEMTDTLDKIHRGRNSLTKAWSALWKEERLKVLEAKLREVQSDLAFSMTIDLRSAIRDSAENQDQILRELRDVKSLNGKSSWQDLGEEAAGSNDSRLGYGGTIVKHLTNGLQLHDEIKSGLIGDLIANIYGSEEKDLSVSDASHIQLSEERKSKLEQLFISRLCYDTMQERELTIKDAHESTFRWIFEENDTTGFEHWLVTNEPLYWITGKPGSGKSTLMKYLHQTIRGSGGNNKPSIASSENPGSTAQSYGRCENHLRRWAGNKHGLTVASFHFWAIGSKLQSSLEGLFRTLLVQLLRAHPEVIPMVAPRRWESLCLFNTDPQNFSQIDLGDMFHKAIVHISTRTNIALFIDGLDEFKGDCNALISLVQSCIVSPVKVCISSRPWNEFEDAFGDCPRLRMQDLTHQDIYNYVSSKFEANIQFKSLQRRQPRVAMKLLESIVKKSSGVFLWVNLVLASLLAGLESGDRVEDLQESIERLPTELGDLYERILETVDSGYRWHTEQLLELMAAFKTVPSPLLFWYADQVDFMDRAMSEDPKNVSSTEALSRVEEIRCRLNGRCQGLLEIHENIISPANPFDPRFGGHIDYLHKTVFEFISSRKTQRKLQNHLRTPYDANIRAAAAYAMFTKGIILCADTIKNKDDISSNLICCLDHAANSSHDSRTEVVRLLDHLTSVCHDIHRDIWFSVAKTRPHIMSNSPTTLLAMNLLYLDYFDALDSRQKMLCLASSMSAVEYVKARAGPGGLIIVQPSTRVTSRDGSGNLMSRVLEKWSGKRSFSLLSLVCLSNPNGASILKHLLERGAKPNMRFTQTYGGSETIRLTPWEGILAEALEYCAIYQEEDKVKDSVLRCVRQMVDGGAKVNLKTVKTARKHANVSIDDEEVYQCLKHMKVDPDAHFEVLFGRYLGDDTSTDSGRTRLR